MGNSGVNYIKKRKKGISSFKRIILYHYETKPLPYEYACLSGNIWNSDVDIIA